MSASGLSCSRRSLLPSPGGLLVQSGNVAIGQHLPEPIQSRHRGPDRHAGWFLELPSCGDRLAGCPLPTAYRISLGFSTELGGLLPYGNDQRDLFQLAATYVDRILRGAKPSELPVQYELVVNLKTSKALGLDVPPLLQQRADEFIAAWTPRSRLF